MRTAAQLLREVSHRDDTDLLSVLLAEQRHRAGLLGLAQGHDIRANLKSRLNLLVDEILDCLQLFLCHRLEMREVKSQPVWIDVRALLLDVRAELQLQRLLEQMRRRMAARRRPSGRLIHLQRHLVSGLQHAARHMANMTDPSAAQVDGILNLEFTVRSRNGSDITALSAHRPIERCPVDNDRSLVAVRKRLRQPALTRDDRDLRGILQMVIAVKDRRDLDRNLVIDRCILAHVVRLGTRISRTLPLLLHAGIERLLVNGAALLLQDLLRQIKREAVGIVQRERFLAVQFLLSFLLEVLLQTVQNGQALIDGAVKVVLLLLQHVEDEFLLLLQLRIAALRGLDDGSGQICQKCMIDAEQSAVARRPSRQSAQHVATSFIGRHDTIRNHERRRADVVDDAADGDILLLDLMILYTCHRADMIAQRDKRIDIKHRIHFLADNRQTLQTHASIDVLLLQRRVMPLTVIFELGEDIVPDLHEAVAVAARLAGVLRPTALEAVLRSAVIVDLRARTARSCPMLPEIVLLAELGDAALRDPDLVMPDLERLVIVKVDRRIKPVRVEPDHLCQKLP